MLLSNTTCGKISSNFLFPSKLFPSDNIFYISERMTVYIKEVLIMEEMEIKEEKIPIQEKICPSSSLEETCTLDVQTEDEKYRNYSLS